MFLVSGQSSHGAGPRQIPLTVLPHLLGTFRADVRTLTWSFKHWSKAGDMGVLSQHLGTKPPFWWQHAQTLFLCDQVWLELNPRPGSVQTPLPQLLVPSPCASSLPRLGLVWGIPTTLATNEIIPSRNSIPCGRVFAARSHDVSYFSSSLSLAVILAQL